MGQLALKYLNKVLLGEILAGFFLKKRFCIVGMEQIAGIGADVCICFLVEFFSSRSSGKGRRGWPDSQKLDL